MDLWKSLALALACGLYATNKICHMFNLMHKVEYGPIIQL